MPANPGKPDSCAPLGTLRLGVGSHIMVVVFGLSALTRWRSDVIRSSSQQGYVEREMLGQWSLPFAGLNPSHAPCHFSSVTRGNLAMARIASSEYGPVTLSAWKKG